MVKIIKDILEIVYDILIGNSQYYKDIFQNSLYTIRQFRNIEPTNDNIELLNYHNKIIFKNNNKKIFVRKSLYCHCYDMSDKYFIFEVKSGDGVNIRHSDIEREFRKSSFLCSHMFFEGIDKIFFEDEYKIVCSCFWGS